MSNASCGPNIDGEAPILIRNEQRQRAHPRPKRRHGSAEAGGEGAAWLAAPSHIQAAAAMIAAGWDLNRAAAALFTQAEQRPAGGGDQGSPQGRGDRPEDPHLASVPGGAAAVHIASEPPPPPAPPIQYASDKATGPAASQVP